MSDEISNECVLEKTIEKFGISSQQMVKERRLFWGGGGKLE